MKKMKANSQFTLKDTPKKQKGKKDKDREGRTGDGKKYCL